MSSKESGNQTLRLTQTALGEDQYRVEIALEGDSTPRRIGASKFSFKLTAQDQEDIRWYLEDYLQYPLDPAPEIAARIEERMAKIGTELFEKVFQAGDAHDLWVTAQSRLANTRVEIITDVREAASIPWELIRDPKGDTPLALRAAAFLRAQPQTAQQPQLPMSGAGDAIRILLVICRPGKGEDVPFRSVAGRLIKGLNEGERQAFQLDVLRPPTFEKLGETLRAARTKGTPYHVVHFDGHGDYLEDALRDLLLSPPRQGAHGYLLFENPLVDENILYVDGSALGRLLAETKVAVMDLNACRSAHAEAPTTPLPAGHDTGYGPHTLVRAFGSLAQEVMDQGVAGVVAMRYNVYVVTAAQFVAEMYAALAHGHTLGEAATLARKQLADQPMRDIAYDPQPLQDWCVPIVYEAAPIALFPKPPEEETLHIELKEEGTPIAIEEKGIDLPPPPDVGFFGRDETLLALDRAFDTQPIVLLHAYAGSGKTATAAEFARWYQLTGGVHGPVLFTSFEQHKPLVRVLDQIEAAFGKALEASGTHWLTLDDEQRREVALQVLKQIPVLWIWDNVEPVTGFPAGTKSAWSKDEQKDLADFLRAARDTKAKFLLTSRRDEKAWLHDLPVRVTLPPMPMQERVQLARALAEKHQYRLTEVDDWRPLLRYTQGNPLTITALVGQALRDSLKTRDQIEAFVDKLRSGEAAFDDDASEGRTRSLGASLRYGFEQAFSEDDRKILALLHLFQGFVNVSTLRLMGNPDEDYCLSEVRGLKREDGIKLLDRGAEIGLLTAHGDGYYSIHPALPWFFKSLFDSFYPSAVHPDSEPPAQKATRAFVEAFGSLGNYYHDQYGAGNRGVIAVLTAEEANLLHARRLARTNGWWDAVIGTMQGLDQLYDHTGRRAEWKRLVEEIVPDFVEAETDGPLPGLEEYWSLVTQYRVFLAEEERQWKEAERLQKVHVEWDRKRAASTLAIPADSLNDAQRNDIRTLGASLHELGEIQRALEQVECEKSYAESLELSERIGEKAGTATCAYNLGHAYLTLPALRNLDQAEGWYRRSLELRDERDRLSRGQCIRELGTVALERFGEARDKSKAKDDILVYLNQALGHYNEALDLLPSNAVNDLAVTHNQIGCVYDEAGQLDRALHHYNKSIQHEESQGNLFGAGQTRYNVALDLMQADRLADALLYAQAARRNFETYGERAAEMMQKTKDLIAQIEKLKESQEASSKP